MRRSVLHNQLGVIMNVAVFADVGNIFYCIGKKYGPRKLDYDKYLAQATGQGNTLYRAIAYGTQINNEANKFIACLQHIGYDVKYRPANAGRRNNWNVGIATDIFRIIDKVDIIYLGTADIEIIPLIEWIKERGVRCVVMACGISRVVRDVADEWIEINPNLLEETESDQHIEDE